MSSISHIGAERCRGSTLILVIVCIAAMAVVVSALFVSAASEATRNRINQASLGRHRVLLNQKQILAEAVWEATQAGGDYSSVATRASAASLLLVNDGWSATLSNITAPVFNLADRAAVFGASNAGPFQISGIVSRSRLFSFTATSTLTGNPSGSAPVTVTQPISVNVVEIPATEFQLVVSDTAFNQSPQTDVIVSGRALFNRGVANRTPMGLRFDGSTTSFGLYLGGANQPTEAAYYSVPTGALSGVTHATGGFSPLFTAPSSPASTMVDRQGFRRTTNSAYRLSWTNPNSDPAGLGAVIGVSRQMVLGAYRIVIDLSTYYGYQNIDVDCTAATRDGGVVVLGSPAGNELNAMPLCISTNGVMVLLGHNARPVITASNYGLVLGPSSSAPAAAATGNVYWTGYIAYGVTNPVIAAAGGSWGSNRFILQGCLQFAGGTLNNAGVPITVASSPSTSLALTSGAVFADRLLLIEQR